MADSGTRIYKSAFPIRVEVCGLCFEIRCSEELEPIVQKLVCEFVGGDGGGRSLELPLISNDGSAGNRPVVSTTKECQGSFFKTIHYGKDEIEIPISSPDRNTVAAAIGQYLVILLSGSCGLLFHSAFLIFNEKGYLFAGDPGAGKTTIAQNSRSAQCVHDDKVAVRKIGNSWFAFGTPMLNGEGVAGKNMKAPLERLYLIEKSVYNQVNEVSGKSALGILPRHVIAPVDNPSMRLQLLDTLFSFVEQLQILELKFERDFDADGIL